MEKLQHFRHLKERQRYAAIHTDSKITLDATANPRNHQNLVEQIREGVRRLEKDNWTIHFTWVKAHNDDFGNELADQLAKKAANSGEVETAYSKIPKSVVIKEIRDEGELEWQKEWNVSTKGEITKTFFPVIGDRKSKKLQMNIKLSTVLTGHGTLRAYYHRFKIINDAACVCKLGPQTTDHLIWECEKLRKQRETLKNRIRKAGGDWPLYNSDLANKHTKWFQMFVNSINFDNL